MCVYLAHSVPKANSPNPWELKHVLTVMIAHIKARTGGGRPTTHRPKAFDLFFFYICTILAPPSGWRPRWSPMSPIGSASPCTYHSRKHRVSFSPSLKQSKGPNRPQCTQAIISVCFFILPAIREIMGIIGLMSFKLKMGSRFPRGARLLYQGHSLHIAAMSNSPAAQIPFTAIPITPALFVVCVCVCDGYWVKVKSTVNKEFLWFLPSLQTTHVCECE